jgi:hypothetical protein
MMSINPVAEHVHHIQRDGNNAKRMRYCFKDLSLKFGLNFKAFWINCCYLRLQNLLQFKVN